MGVMARSVYDPTNRPVICAEPIIRSEPCPSCGNISCMQTVPDCRAGMRRVAYREAQEGKGTASEDHDRERWVLEPTAIMMSWLSRVRLIAWHGLRWRRTLSQIARLPERDRP